MKTLIGLILVPLALALGSADSSAMVKKTGSGSQAELREEVSDGGAVPQGYAELQIYASFKTHQPGLYSAGDPHGTEGYQLQLNVDGETVVLPGELQAERLAVTEPGDPETGTGIRYRFRKVLRMKAGSHRIVVSLPADDIALTREVTLHEGQENRLVLEPVYGRVSEKKRPSANRITDFQQGISRLTMTLNGRRI